ncbi:MAG: MoxR family ATPase [Lentisphaeria bacterium]|nr:MoxR family ATPase [Lentisphaeria bacterium]
MNEDIKNAGELAGVTEDLRGEIAKVIIGQEDVIEQLLIGLFCHQHCFMVGVPGLAKTLMVSTLSRVLNLNFKRIQFTPDLMPSDIIGTDIIQDNPASGKREFTFFRGPVFANLVLADEINRTPPKTQAALLEAMQERQVTVGTRTLKLEEPFFVLATQNPIEQEGTYPLPEAQLDRFMLSIRVNYPQPEEELDILRMTTVDQEEIVKPVLQAEDIIRYQKLVRRVPVPDHVYTYALELVRRTRPTDTIAPPFIKEWVDFGAGPRAGQNLIFGAKARALMKGRSCATSEDVAILAKPVLRHRVVTNFNADSEGVGAEAIIERLLAETPVHGDD